MKPITRILIVIAITIICCQLISYPLNKGLAKYYHHTDRRLREIMYDSTAHDVLLIGSSRIYRNVNPRIIDSICAVNSYNAGCGFARLAEIEMIFDGYLETHPMPKTVVLNLDLFSFEKKKFIFKYQQFLPFIKNNSVYNTLLAYGYRVDLIRILPFLSFSDLDDLSKGNAVKGLKGKGASELKEGESEYKGFLSLSDEHMSIADLTAKTQPKYSEISDAAIASLKNIIHTCHKYHTNIIFTYAPEYDNTLQNQTSNKKEIFDYIAQTARENNIPFLRYDTMAISRQDDIFWDSGHLNKTGSGIYSAMLATDILPYIHRDRPDHK